MINIIETITQEYNLINYPDTIKYHKNNNKINNPFIISLPKDTAKYNHANLLLKSLGMNAIKLNAISGKTIKNNHPNIYRTFSNLSDGEIGCFLSHIAIYYLASKHPNQDQYTLIFEDDVDSLADKFKISYYVGKALQYSPNIVYLGKCLERCDHITQLSENLYYGSTPLCLHAYMIKNSFARKIIHHLNIHVAINSPIDIFIQQFEEKPLIFHPSLFYQNVAFKSNLRDKKDQYVNLLECREAMYYPFYYYFKQKIVENYWISILFIVIVVVIIVKKF
jgi:GR25 family glycosyltransferase involved in LPS biosynthesis